MMTIIDIYKAIRKRLESHFYDFETEKITIPVQTKDLKNPNPPCFYIKFITDKTIKSTVKHETSNISFDVLYFSKDLTQIDLLRIEKELKKAFKKPLEVLVKNEYYLSDEGEILDEGDINYLEINAISTSFNEDDYILNCTLDLEVNQLIVSEGDYATAEMLDEMILQINKEQ